MGARFASAMVSAYSVSSTVIRWLIAQPTTRREYRSSSTARYSQPSIVQICVRSPAHT